MLNKKQEPPRPSSRTAKPLLALRDQLAVCARDDWRTVRTFLAAFMPQRDPHRKATDSTMGTRKTESEGSSDHVPRV